MSGKLKVPKFRCAKAEDPVYKSVPQVFTPVLRVTNQDSQTDKAKAEQLPANKINLLN